MFKGIVEATGRVKDIEKKGGSGRITVETPFRGKNALAVGGSIAVDGVCLTVEEIRDGIFSAHISGETLGRTTLGRLRRGDRVNLERPLTPGTPLGGHLVTGHVDCTGRIEKKERLKEGLLVHIFLPEEYRRYVAEKGSVAVDGISLTVCGLLPQGFSVVLVPHTVRVTTIGDKPVGGTVNIETDIIAKYVERFLTGHRGGITEAFLKEHGFIKEQKE